MRRRKGKEKRKKRKKKKEKKEKNKGMFSCMESSVFWISRVLVWRLVPPFSRVLGRDHINPRILEVLGGKP